MRNLAGALVHGHRCAPLQRRPQGTRVECYFAPVLTSLRYSHGVAGIAPSGKTELGERTARGGDGSARAVEQAQLRFDAPAVLADFGQFHFA